MVQKVSGKLPEVKQKSLGYQKLKNNVHYRVLQKAFFREQVMGFTTFSCSGSK